ncbi:hypothetical protein GCAAIG_13680 [Candidatus Electronema halotolerans]
MKGKKSYSRRPVCLLAPAALIAALGLGTASHAFAAQEIDVQGGADNTSIADGSATPSVDDGTDFGGVETSTDAVKTYTILNTGDADLTLNGTPLVKLNPVATDDKGCDAFSVTTQPTSPIAATKNTTFTVTYNQAASGSLDKCQISIANDDDNENPYDFVIQGSTVPEMDVQGKTVSITDGDTTPSAADDTLFTAGSGSAKTYTILNTGGGDLTLSGTPLVDLVEFADGDGSCDDFSVTAPPTSPIAAGGNTTFVVTYTPTGDENGTPCKVSIANNDADENPYDFAIQVALPEIDVQGNSVSIADGHDTPSSADDTDFGGVPTSTDVTKTYTILNIGGADLTLDGTDSNYVVLEPVADGDAGCGAFTVTQPTETTIAAGASTTFTVTYNQETVNTVDKCGISIANDDADENPYDFTIQASTGPEMDVQGNSVSIADGDDTPDMADDTDFGGVPTSTDVTKTYTILNIGGAELTLGVDPVTNDAAAGCNFFTITQPAETTPIAAGASTTFTVTYKQATANTLNTCGISIANNDADEGPSYDFVIQASTGPEMDVQGNSVSIADGDDTPDVADDTDFGTVNVGKTLSKAYTILNTGGANLTLDGDAPDYVVLNGEGCASFKVTTQPTTPIAVGATSAVTFTVEYAPTAVSEGEQCTVSIDNNDSNENPYDFVIQGKGGKSGASYLPAVYEVLLNGN